MTENKFCQIQVETTSQSISTTGLHVHNRTSRKTVTGITVAT